MKKYLLLLVIVLVGVLSACSGESEEPCCMDPDYNAPNLNDRLSFDWTTMTYSKSLGNTDILRDTGSITDDFLLLRDLADYDSLSEDQQTAYSQTLLALYTVDIETDFDLGMITATSLTEFTTYASSTSVEITTTEAFTYPMIQTETSELQSVYGTYVSRLDYIEYHLGRELNGDEIIGLNSLQEYVTTLYIDAQVTYNIEVESFDRFKRLLQTELQYIPTEVEEGRLFAAYEIISLMHATK